MGGKLFLLLFISVLMLAFGNKPRWKSSNEFNEHLNVIQDNKLSNIFLKKRQIWQNYKEKHMKSYDKVEDEEHMRHFLVSHNFVKNHNYQYKQGAVSFKTAINHIADLSLNEYKNLNGYRPLYGVANNGRKNSSRFLAPLNVQIPDEIDWRDHGYVTDVKDQGNCASCWAFSSTGALEGQHKRAFKKLVSLSEQNLIDCSTPYGNKGCMGGLMEFAYQYVKDNKGIDTETSYPYEAKKDSCHFNINSIGADDTGYVELTEGDEEELKIAVATQGPISVAIDASHKSFQLYSSGVFYEKKCSSKNLDHGVLIVGYGTDPEHGDYWIVKNSWSKYWGERGYIRMARNKKNHCGIASKASYPLV